MAFRIPDACRPAFLIDITAGTLITLGMWFTGLANPVLRKTLAAPEQLVAVLIAIQTAVMILSPGWAGASHLRRKAPFITFGALTTGSLLIVAGALTPTLQHWLPQDLLNQTFLGSSIDIWAFFLLMALVFAASSGFSALQVAIYRHNYPVAVRAKVVTRVNAVKVSVTLVVGVAVSLLMQWRPELYAAFMILGGLCLIVGGFV